MTLPALYEIAETYRKALETLGDLDLPDQVVQDTLESLQGDLQAKSTNVAAFCLHLESISESIKQAEKKMAHRRKILENRAESVKDYLKTCMERAGVSKIECPYFKLQIKKNPPKVVIYGEVPVDFLRIIPAPPPEPDKKAINEFLNNFSVDWAHLAQSTRLDID